MAAGKLIVGAVNGSCANFIKNNEVGFSCKSGDSVALANLINTLDIEELKRIGKKSKEVYFAKYSKANFISSLISKIECFTK